MTFMIRNNIKHLHSRINHELYDAYTFNVVFKMNNDDIFYVHI